MVENTDKGNRLANTNKIEKTSPMMIATHQLETA